ncbi:MAG TPA: hypothetical protein VIB78_00415 [Acidimicrobiia bacterium]
MTGSWERPQSAWPLGAWIMAAMLATAMAVAISTSVLSPGLLLDAISLWPGLVPALIALLLIAFRKAWRRRAGAVPALLIITWLLLASAAHLSAWVALPSSSGELIGPANSAGIELATASISPGGRLVVESSADDALYQVRFLRLGGPVGVPAATEVTGGTGLNISVSDRGTTRWFRYAGWRLLLRPETVWNLNLGGDVSGDLSALALGSLTLNGSGTVTLSAVTKSTPLAVLGSYVITLPAGAVASVSGEADVPEAWIETEDGFASGVEGEGWIISVAEEGSLRVNQP